MIIKGIDIGDEAERAALTNLKTIYEERLINIRLRIEEIDKKLEGR